MKTIAKAKKPAKKTTFEVSINREIHAPCETVFAAWTDAKQMAHWFSPKEIECKSVSANIKVGGAFRIHMVSKEGDHIAIGKYLEIEQNKRLRFTWEWTKYAMPESVVTVDFEDLGKTTRLTLTHAGLPDQEDATGHKKGWTSMLEKFGEAMESNKSKAAQKGRK